MIKTKLVNPEFFNNVLKEAGVKTLYREVEVEVKTGLFGRTSKETRKEPYKQTLFKLDEDLIKTFPKDIQKKIRSTSFSPEGYPHFIDFTYGMNYVPVKSFTRSFDLTLNDFYRYNKITKDNLISLEYCRDPKDPCEITGAYVTWEVLP